MVEGILSDAEFAVMVISACYKIILGLVAMVMGFGSLLLMLKCLGISITQWGKNAERQALGTFFGLLFIGICIMFGLILS